MTKAEYEDHGKGYSEVIPAAYVHGNSFCMYFDFNMASKDHGSAYHLLQVLQATTA